MIRAVVAVCLGVAAAACASRGDVDGMGESLRGEIRALEEGQRVLLDRIGGSLDSLGVASERRETTSVAELDRRIRRVETMMEQIIEGLAENSELLADIYENQRQAGAPSPLGPPVAGRGPASPGTVSSAGDEEAAQFYGMALNTYNQGLLEAARGAFRDFGAQWPRHELAPDAQYMLAVTFEDEGDIGNALEEFRRLSELYPNSDRAPAALYRRGMIEAERGNTALARQLFTQIESGYPNSLEASAARRERERLGG